MSTTFPTSSEGDALRALLAEILRRLDDLETANPFNRASVDRGSGIAVNTAGGVHVEGTGTMTAGEASMSRANGGRFKAGAAELDGFGGGRVGAGTTRITADGSIVSSTGELLFAGHGRFSGDVTTDGTVQGGYVKSLGDMNADGTVRGYAGVMAPVSGAMQSLGPQIELAKATANGAASAAASAASAAADAQAAADDAVPRDDFNGLKAIVDSIKSMPLGDYPPPSAQWRMVVTNGVGDFRAIPGPWA